MESGSESSSLVHDPLTPSAKALEALEAALAAIAAVEAGSSALPPEGGNGPPPATGTQPQPPPAATAQPQPTQAAVPVPVGAASGASSDNAPPASPLSMTSGLTRPLNPIVCAAAVRSCRPPCAERASKPPPPPMRAETHDIVGSAAVRQNGRVLSASEPADTSSAAAAALTPAVPLDPLAIDEVDGLLAVGMRVRTAFGDRGTVRFVGERAVGRPVWHCARA